MSIILPEEIVEHIISFTCDRRGYNAYHYNIRKRLNWYRMDRILKEIKYFKQLDVSIGWLKKRPDSLMRTIFRKCFATNEADFVSLKREPTRICLVSNNIFTPYLSIPGFFTQQTTFCGNAFVIFLLPI